MTLLMEEVKAIHYVADKPFSCQSKVEDCNEWDYPGLPGNSFFPKFVICFFLYLYYVYNLHFYREAIEG